MKREIKFYRMKMELPTQKGEVARYYSDIVYVEYDKPYCKFYFANEKTVYIFEITMKRLMEEFPAKSFFQCSRKTIINICRYSEYTESPPVILMDNGKELKMSHRRLEAFKQQKANLVRISPLCEKCYSCHNVDCQDHFIFCSQENPD